MEKKAAPKMMEGTGQDKEAWGTQVARVTGSSFEGVPWGQGTASMSHLQRGELITTHPGLGGQGSGSWTASSGVTVFSQSPGKCYQERMLGSKTPQTLVLGHPGSTLPRVGHGPGAEFMLPF